MGAWRGTAARIVRSPGAPLLALTPACGSTLPAHRRAPRSSLPHTQPARAWQPAAGAARQARGRPAARLQGLEGARPAPPQLLRAQARPSPVPPPGPRALLLRLPPALRAGPPTRSPQPAAASMRPEAMPRLPLTCRPPCHPASPAPGDPPVLRGRRRALRPGARRLGLGARRLGRRRGLGAHQPHPLCETPASPRVCARCPAGCLVARAVRAPRTAASSPLSPATPPPSTPPLPRSRARFSLPTAAARR
jgi:hypothetical protein